MWRQVVFTMSLALVSAATGPLDATATCEERCADDDERGDCAPDCDDCSCCFHVRTAPAAPVAVGLLPGAPSAVPVALDEPPPDPGPADILTVPIAA